MPKMSNNKLAKEFDTSGWQWQDKSGHVYQLEDLTRADLIQVACACMTALEAAESASMMQQEIFEAWRNGGKIIPRTLPNGQSDLRAVLADCQAHLACNAVTDDLVALYGRVRSALGA